VLLEFVESSVSFLVGKIFARWVLVLIVMTPSFFQTENEIAIAILFAGALVIAYCVVPIETSIERLSKHKKRNIHD